MKRNNMLALILVLLLTLVFPAAAFGEDLEGETQTTVEEETKDDLNEEVEETEEESETEEDLEESNGKEKPWKAAKAFIQQEKNAVEALKDGVEAELDALELKLEEAEAAGDEAIIAALKLQIEALKVTQNEYKVQMKEKIALMQQVMREKYSVEELEALNEVSEELNSLENVDVIPVENIFIKNGNAKFDTPPVIKHGRTLIPVRAISEALGATVEYNADEKAVTITKDDKVIILYLGEQKVLVNGAETTIDVPAEIMNNRTMVPIRFIAEQLEFEVEWNQELQTIEIE